MSLTRLMKKGWSDSAVSSQSVANVASVATPFHLLPKEQARVLAWLTHVGETDPELIEEVLTNCNTKPGAREYFLRRAMEVPDAAT